MIKIFPRMLVMRNNPAGLIWQAYETKNEVEEIILTRNAKKNGFCVEVEREGYTEETSPGWREDRGWKKCLREYQKEVSELLS